MPAPDFESGFSLLEVIAVMLILAVLLAIGGYAATTSKPGVSIRADVHNVATRLRQARLSAIRLQRPVSAMIDTRSHVITANDGLSSLSLDRNYAVIVTTAQTELRNNGVAGIRFFPNGGSSGATLELVSGNSRHEVRVNWLTGRISTKQVR